MAASILPAILLAALAGGAPEAEAAVEIAVDVARPGAAIDRRGWGIFFEDFNSDADGGIYAELVMNRSFEFPEALHAGKEARRGAASYHVQRLFSRNRGDRVLPVRIGGPSGAGGRRVYASAVREAAGGPAILKVVNADAEPLRATVRLEGASAVGPGASAEVLAGKTLADENSLEEPAKIAPRAAAVEAASPGFAFTFEPYSLTVLRVPLGK